MRIFLTGASGFVGSHLLEQLAGSEHKTAILLRPKGNRQRIEKWLDRVEVIEGELSRQETWSDALNRFAPETVIHLAWGGVLNKSRDDVGQVQNVTDTIELVKTAHQAGATAWIGLGSQAEYGPCNRRIDENQPTNPTTLYGTSKLASCWLARSLCAKLGLRFAWLRLFSSFGPGDDPSWMIPSLILKLLSGGRPALTGCEQLWDYLYVADAAEAILMTALSANAEGVFNLGSGEAWPLREVVESIRDLVKPGAPLGFGEIPYRPDQVMHLEADISRLKNIVGWRPRTSLAEGLKKTVAFYSAVTA